MTESEGEFIYSDEEEDEEEEHINSSSRPLSSKSLPSLRLSLKKEEEEYKVLDIKQLAVERTSLIEQLIEVLSVTADVAALLLLHFKWNKETVINEYFSDPNSAKENSGIFFETEYQEKQDETKSKAEQEELYLCPVMFDEYPIKETYSMGCTSKEHPQPHRFSLVAWREYLKNKVSEGGRCVYTTCPMDFCSCVVPPSVWKGILCSPSNFGIDVKQEEIENCLTAFERYDYFLTVNYVELSENVKWCPTPDCGRAVKAALDIEIVNCSNCGNKFCFKCNFEAHEPVTCLLLSKWVDKCQNESETANWILTNTKSCPKCGVRIEKNQGCNHMNCGKCQHQFCWVCLQDWSQHDLSGGYYNCNKYKEKEQKGNDAKTRAKRELDKYLHYYKRYAAHDQSGQFARKQLKEAEAKMAAIQTGKGQGYVEVQFLGDAVRQLIQNRRMLKYTYALAYYLPEGPLKTLFEHNQSDLEKYTEQLSELTERPWEEINKVETTDKMMVTRKFMQRINEAVQKEGLVEKALEEWSRRASEANDPTNPATKKKKSRR